MRYVSPFPLPLFWYLPSMVESNGIIPCWLLRGPCDCERTTHGAHWKRRKVKRKNSIGDIIEILEVQLIQPPILLQNLWTTLWLTAEKMPLRP